MHSSNQRPALRGDGRLGVAALTRAAYAGADIDELAASLLAQLELYPDDFSILMDLSVVEQLRGNLEFGLELQDAALKHDPLVETACALPPALNVLVLAAPIRMGGNTPVDFLVDGAPIRLTTLFVGPDLPFPDRLPPHDLAFVAAPGDSDESRHYLSEIERRLPGWPVPVLNQPGSIRKLERDRVAAELEGVPGLVLARTERCSRETLRELGTGRRKVADLMPGIEFPLIVRPVGSHAGRDLERLSHPSEIPAYLAGCADEEFFLSDYIDYRSADGAFRKYRIVFVDGRPMPCHMAIADMWKVWYMNAEMSGSAAKRAEEERFFASFDHDFRARHAETFAAMTSRFGLEYFGIDCAEDRDGNLVLFEADSALIVHDMDSEEVFSYKKAPMKRVFAAFSDMLRRKVVRRRQPVEKLRAS